MANRGEIARRVVPHLPRPRHRHGRGVLRRRTPTARIAPTPTAPSGCPARRPADTYLRADLLIAAARAAGADAVHPGYGFLSENAGFAQAVLDAGLAWIGPPPAAIAAMGSKVEAKKLMADAGVPVLPELDPAAVTDADLPVLIKASAGGGGRGMRIVRDAGRAARGAGRPRAPRPRRPSATRRCSASRTWRPAAHLEVQVLADRHGTVGRWASGSARCSGATRR